MSDSEKPRVLVVDDSRIVRATLVKQLHERCSIIEAADGEAGWDALVLDEGIDVLITDLSMPRLDGYGLIQRVRASEDPHLREMPVLLISGDEDESARERAVQIGATDFITKGTGGIELLARVEAALQSTRKTDALEVARQHQVRVPESGLYSQDYLLAQAQQVLSLARRHGQPACAMIIALDHLEALAEQHGSAPIRQLVIRFGQMLAARVRKEDTLGHWGTPGEDMLRSGEFGVLVPATPEPGAIVFAERLREAVESANIMLDGRRVELTVSIGLCDGWIDAVHDAADWLGLAAARMAQARTLGGNRVVTSQGKALMPPRPTLEHALSLLAAGREAEVSPHVHDLFNAIQPLLALARKHRLL